MAKKKKRVNPFLKLVAFFTLSIFFITLFALLFGLDKSTKVKILIGSGVLIVLLLLIGQVKGYQIMNGLKKKLR